MAVAPIRLGVFVMLPAGGMKVKVNLRITACKHTARGGVNALETEFSNRIM